MVPDPLLLIHTALYHEAVPIIERLGLKQYETKPFKVFRGNRAVLAVSGPGKQNTETALHRIFEKERFQAALNVGAAGAAAPGVYSASPRLKKGTPVWVRHVCDDVTQKTRILTSPAVCPLETADLLTVRRPVTDFSTVDAPLVDMEGAWAYDLFCRFLPCDRIGILKTVSDYGDDKIPKKEETQALLATVMTSAFPYAVHQVLKKDATKLKTVPKYLFTAPSVWMEIASSESFSSLDSSDRQALETLCCQARLSHSKLRQLVDYGIDFRSFAEDSLFARIESCRSKKDAFDEISAQWRELKTRPASYKNFVGKPSSAAVSKRVRRQTKETLGFGDCPVASPKTRCCNLKTLDALEGCAFDCSYCAVKTFYRPGEITVDDDFAAKIDALELPPDKMIHIGTGQSSDSLLLGNQKGELSALFRLAKRYPRLILEFKTKTDNLSWLKKLDIPQNVIFTWSLNTPTVIQHEEHGTASLNRRLAAAAQMARLGYLVGFHFHPMAAYEGWQQEYRAVFDTVRDQFSKKDVALISFGTLTFTKAVIKALRRTPMVSKVLQMPFVEIAGKYSYPFETKQALFSTGYRAFQDWHSDVFFYLCMEDIDLWRPVLGRSYPDNESFEEDMCKSYLKKIKDRIRRTEQGGALDTQ